MLYIPGELVRVFTLLEEAMYLAYVAPLVHVFEIPQFYFEGPTNASRDSYTQARAMWRGWVRLDK